MMPSEPRWRFYIEPRSGDNMSSSVCVVKMFKAEGCGLYFQADDTGVSPPFYFGRTPPKYRGSKACFRTSDVPTAMRAISVVRDEFIRQRMGKFGFHAVDDLQDNETFCDAVMNDDGSIVVVSTHRNYRRELVQTIWEINPSRVMCRGKYVYEGEQEFFAFPEGTATIPRDQAEKAIHDALRGFYDAKVALMMDAGPATMAAGSAAESEEAEP